MGGDRVGGGGKYGKGRLVEGSLQHIEKDGFLQIIPGGETKVGGHEAHCGGKHGGNDDKLKHFSWIV